MPQYLSAQALLEDVRLRLDAFGALEAAIVVEGWDDKRVFRRYARRPQQIVVAGGKRLLIAARDAADADDAGRILFVADCDFDVPLGRMSPGNGLVVTTHADVESDLIDLGVLEHVVAELVSVAIHEDRLGLLTAQVHERAVSLASRLGQIRLAGLAFCEALDVHRLELRKFRRQHSAEVDFEKLIRSAYTSTSDPQMSLTDFTKRVHASSPSYSACNGHDLVRAIADVIRRDFKGQGATEESVARCVRLSFSSDMFDRWEVATRVRAWEDAMGRMVLLRAGFEQPSA